MLDVKLADISGKKKTHIKAKIEEIKLTVRSKILGTCIRASVALKCLPA